MIESGKFINICKKLQIIKQRLQEFSTERFWESVPVESGQRTTILSLDDASNESWSLLLEISSRLIPKIPREWKIRVLEP